MLKKILLLCIGLWIILISGCEIPQPGMEDDPEVEPTDGVYVVFARTDSKGEAIRKADQFISDKYKCKVYATPNNYYVVVLGKYTREKANRVRNEAIQKGIIKEADTYISNGESFGAEVYPGGSAEKTIVIDKMFHVVVDSSETRTRAIRRANSLIAEGFYSEVFHKSNNYYVVTLGHFPRERALRVREGAREFSFIDGHSYLDTGQEFLSREYSFQDADSDAVFADLKKELNALPVKKQPAAPKDTTPPIVEKEEYGGMESRQDAETYVWPKDDPLDRDNYSDVDMSDDARYNREDHDNFRPKKGSKFNRDKEEAVETKPKKEKKKKDKDKDR